MTPEKFGAVGDGIADDTQAIKEAAKHTSATGELFTDAGGKIYEVSEPITFHNRANVDLFDSQIKGEVIVSKKEPGTMRVNVTEGRIAVKRLPKCSSAQFRANNCGHGIHLQGDIEACELHLEVDDCIDGIHICPDESNRTLDQCKIKIRCHNTYTILNLHSFRRQITANFEIFAEQIKGNAILISGACRVSIGGLLRGICKNQSDVAIFAFDDEGRPHITLDNLSLIGSRVEGAQPFNLEGVREFGGTVQVTNF